MNKTKTKQLFKAIEQGDEATVLAILDDEPDAIEAIGAHNQNVRDKTPLMYAMQCSDLKLANAILDRGANAAAVMTGGPCSSALSLCMTFAYCDAEKHDEWIRLATRLLDEGADPNTGLWPALHAVGGIVNRSDLIQLALDRGADPDRQVGNSGNTVLELVQINAHLYSPEVLALFGLESEVAQEESSFPIEPPFMEHPSGDYANAEAALIDAMERLDELGEVERWIHFNGQGRGQTDDTYVVRDVAYRNGFLDLTVDNRELNSLRESVGLSSDQVQRDDSERLDLTRLTPLERGAFLNQVFLTHFGLKPTRRGRDYAVAAEWR